MYTTGPVHQAAAAAAAARHKVRRWETKVREDKGRTKGGQRGTKGRGGRDEVEERTLKDEQRGWGEGTKHKGRGMGKKQMKKS